MLILGVVVGASLNGKGKKELHCKLNVKQKPLLHFISLLPKPALTYKKKRQICLQFSLLTRLICRRLRHRGRDTKSSQANFTGCSHCNSLIRQGCTEKRKAINLEEFSCPKETTAMEQQCKNKVLGKNCTD